MIIPLVVADVAAAAAALLQPSLLIDILYELCLYLVILDRVVMFT